MNAFLSYFSAHNHKVWAVLGSNSDRIPRSLPSLGAGSDVVVFCERCLVADDRNAKAIEGHPRNSERSLRKQKLGH